MIELRSMDKANIIYIILIEDYSQNLPFIPPYNVNPLSLDYIKYLPKNLYQIDNAVFYLSLEINSEILTPYNIVFCKRNNADEFIESIISIERVIVIITDHSKKEDNEILHKINNLKKAFVYNIQFNVPNTESSDLVNELLQKIVNHKKEIFKHLNIDTNGEFEYYNNHYDLNKLKEYCYFSPTKNNHLVYNNYLGNFGITDDVTEIQLKEYSKKAQSINRIDYFLPQLKAFDELYSKFRIAKSPKRYYYNYNPLYFSIPFHNPDIKDFFKDKSNPIFKKIISALQVEQNSNYFNNIKAKSEEIPLFTSGIELLQARLQFLDSTSYLMSSFNFSPYVRLPILGKSVYKELSFIAPKNFSKFLTLKAQNSLNKTIKKIGNNLSNSLFSSNFKKYLSKRDSQIVSITDLPFEWVEIEGVPLLFTHDITRIPETNFNNHLNSFINNSFFDFKISENIISNTLVIIGTDDENILQWHEILVKLSEKEKFKIEICLSIEEFTNAIEKFNPDFLIIDTHGGFDETRKETFLHIGKEQLTYQEIIDNNIHVPLVFLSACGTSPTYGTFTPIANAFLQLGSRSVTSTYLPVDINNSTMVYLSILDNLNKVANEGTFKNWLEYICFNIRSSFIHRMYEPTLLEKKEHEEYNHDYCVYIQDIQNFARRKHIYKSIQEYEAKMSKKLKNYIIPKAYEFLYYTNIGRGDLVTFEKYEYNFEKLNEYIFSLDKRIE